VFFPPIEDWSALESPSFINALSARLPTVEPAAGGEGISPTRFDFTGLGEQSGFGANGNGIGGFNGIGIGGGDYGIGEMGKGEGKAKEEKIVKITWWRPHGPTAIAPGESKCLKTV